MASEECMESWEPASFKANKEQTLPEVMNDNSYLRIDNNIQRFNDDDSLVDDIAEALLSKWPCQEDSSEDEDSD